MHIAVERLTPELEHEISDLVERYYDTTNAHVRIPPYDFVWEAYEALERMGNLLVVTARVDEQSSMLGVAMYVISECLHHRGYMIAECDSLSVDHNHRGNGIAKSIYLVAESVLIDKGIQRVIHHYRTVYDETPLFPKLGFALEELIYMKDL